MAHEELPDPGNHDDSIEKDDDELEDQSEDDPLGGELPEELLVGPLVELLLVAELPDEPALLEPLPLPEELPELLEELPGGGTLPEELLGGGGGGGVPDDDEMGGLLDEEPDGVPLELGGPLLALGEPLLDWPPLEDEGPELLGDEDDGPLDDPLDDPLELGPLLLGRPLLEADDDDGPLDEPPEEDDALLDELALPLDEEEPEELPLPEELPEELPDELPLELPDEEELPLGGQQSTSFSYWNQYSIFGCGSVPKRTSFIRTMALVPTGNSRQLHGPAPLLLDGTEPSQQSSMKSAQQRSRWSRSTPFPSIPFPSLGSSIEL